MERPTRPDAAEHPAPARSLPAEGTARPVAGDRRGAGNHPGLSGRPRSRRDVDRRGASAAVAHRAAVGARRRVRPGGLPVVVRSMGWRGFFASILPPVGSAWNFLDSKRSTGVSARVPCFPRTGRESSTTRTAGSIASCTCEPSTSGKGSCSTRATATSCRTIRSSPPTANGSASSLPKHSRRCG